METESTSTAAPRWKPLTARQRRIVGVLVEKAKTTPDGYPMSLNALVNGCNQKSNRSPQMNVNEVNVEDDLELLRAMGAVAEVQSSGRVAKYRHYMKDWLGVEKQALAVMAELLLRGEQTLGELRGRAARMEPISDVATLRPIVDSLISAGLVISLTPPGRGQVVTHNLYTEPELERIREQFGSISTAPPATTSPSPSPTQPIQSSTHPNDDVASLRAEIDSLRAQVEQLGLRVAKLEQAASDAD